MTAKRESCKQPNLIYALGQAILQLAMTQQCLLQCHNSMSPGFEMPKIMLAANMK